MPIKHAISILMSRFSLTYKTLLYAMIVILVFVLIGVIVLLPVIRPLTSALNEVDFIEHMGKTIKDIVTGNAEAGQQNYEVLTKDMQAISKIFAENTLSISLSIVWIVIVIMLFKIVMSMCYYPISDVVNKFMACNSRYGFTSNFIHNIGISARYSLMEFVVSIPYYIVCLGIIFGIGYLIFMLSSILSVMIAFALLVIVISAKKTLLSFWLPHLIYTNGKVVKSFKEQFVIGKHKFVKVFGMYIITNLMMFAFITLFGLMTFGIGFFVGYAMCVVLCRIIDMVVYYRDQDHKYYVEPKKVIDAKSEIV